MVIDSINAVEDTKGNNGERGAFSVTNLRIIWCSHANPNINLSTFPFAFHRIDSFIAIVQFLLLSLTWAILLYLSLNDSRGRMCYLFVLCVIISVAAGIGFDCVVSMSIRSASSRLRGGNVQALHVMTKFNNSRFEFIFTSLVKNSPRLFTTIQAVSRAYETTRVYRDVKYVDGNSRSREIPLQYMRTL